MLVEKVETRTGLDWVCDVTFLIFLSVLVGFGPNAKDLFLLAEILFIVIFSARFLIRRSLLSWYTLWSATLVILGLLSTTYAPSRESAMTVVISLVQVVLFGNLIVPYFMDSKRNRDTFYRVFIVAGVVLALHLLSTASLEQLMNSRIGGTININANRVGFSFAICSIIASHLVITEKRYWYIFFVVFFAIASMFSGSRKVMALLVIGIFLIGLFTREPSWKSFGTLLGIVLLLFSLFYLAYQWEPLYNVLGSRIDTFIAIFTNGGTDGSTSIRLTMMQDGWRLFLEKPLLGWGLNAFREIVEYEMYSHNNYIEILVSLGSIGFIWYFGFLLLLCFQGGKQLLTGKRTNSIVLSLALLCTFFVDYMGRVHLYNEITHIIYAFSFAAVYSEKPQTGFDVVTWVEKRLHLGRKVAQ